VKLHNDIQTVEIGGHPVRVGRLTVAAACEIESYLETLESPLEFIDSNVLAKPLPRFVPDPDNEGALKEVNSAEVAEILIQRSMEWPPDAIGALCDVRMVRRAKFGKVFVGAMIRAYNGHMKPDKIDEIVNSALVPFDPLTIQPIALGITDDPKDESGLAVATSPASGSSGGGSSPS
jgi:hypothetical protein